MVVSGREFIHETSSSQRRARAVRAARSLLTAVARLLIMADMVDVHLMLMNIARVSLFNAKRVVYCILVMRYTVWMGGRIERGMDLTKK